MKFKYKSDGFGGDSWYESNITNVIDSQSKSYEQSKAEFVHEKVKKSIDLTEKLIDILYAKGLLNDKDVKELIMSVTYFNEDSIEIISDNKQNNEDDEN